MNPNWLFVEPIEVPYFSQVFQSIPLSTSGRLIEDSQFRLLPVVYWPQRPLLQRLSIESIGALPRITRLMALAIHFDGLIQSGLVTNYAELARLGNVTRARVTQIMNLLMLAPAIQEELLFLPRQDQGRGEVCLRDLQRVAGVVEWAEQACLWSKLPRPQTG